MIRSTSYSSSSFDDILEIRFINKLYTGNVTYVTSYVQKDLELVFNQGNVSSFWAFESTFEVKNTVIAGFRHLMAQVSHFTPL